MKPCPDTFPFPLVALDETASTNQYLSQLCNQLQESVAELTTVTAEFQTAGKGQRGNTWEAEEGKNLLFSFVLYPSFLEARRQFILSQIVSLAIKEELSRWSDEITIKWPNDIYWKDKKICGILIENDLSGHHIRRSIAGIGININQEVFNSDAPNPVSLKQITGKEHDRYEILAHILRRVQIYYNSLQMEDFAVYSDEISTRYARSLFRRRGLHPYEDANGKFLARLLRVEQDGRFVLEDEGGSERENAQPVPSHWQSCATILAQPCHRTGTTVPIRWHKHKSIVVYYCPTSNFTSVPFRRGEANFTLTGPSPPVVCI